MFVCGNVEYHMGPVFGQQCLESVTIVHVGNTENDSFTVPMAPKVQLSIKERRFSLV
jgi:hypothetical protein